MDFSWSAYISTILFVLFETMLSWRDKTFSRKQKREPPIRISFLWHWGLCIGDLVILPVFNGLVIPHLHFSYLHIVPLFFSAMITTLCHHAWWPKDPSALGVVFPDWRRSERMETFWYRDLSPAGWAHALFMTVQIVLIASYIFTPMPEKVVRLSSALFMLFIPFGVIEPGMAECWPPTNKKVAQSLAIAFSLWVLVFFVGWLKMP